jgi:hypothetical protein
MLLLVRAPGTKGESGRAEALPHTGD